MTLHIQTRPEQAKEILLTFHRRRNLILRSLVGGLATYGVVKLVLWHLQIAGGDPTAGGLLLTMAALLLLMQTFVMRRQIKAYTEAMQTMCREEPRQRITFGDGIVCERGGGEQTPPDWQSTFRYGDLLRVMESKNLLLLCTRANSIIALPKCDLTPEQLAAVKRLMQALHIPGRLKKEK